MAESLKPPRPFTPPWQADQIPRRAVAADLEKLWHDNTYGRRPLYYLDVSFTCIDCGKSEIWTAAQQKWWYEEAKGLIDSRAACLILQDYLNEKFPPPISGQE